RAQGSAIADEAIQRIAQLYAVEKEARRSPPDRRAALRPAQAGPIFDDLETWLHAPLPSTSGKSPLAGAIRYALTRMARLRCCCPAPRWRGRGKGEAIVRHCGS
ncbi:IS66 family transposase, partial [Epibacterium ulvae]|uniref:IS66 family transposase n=1 Tax=Epibacterium ulvae TaxID=1156985 RepID=UPI001BFCBA66